MAIRLTDLISRVPASVEHRVRRIRDNTRSVIQDALRAECRLLLRTPAETDNRHWPKTFNNDSTLTSAVLDRLLHHAETVILEGKSYRLKD